MFLSASSLSMWTVLTLNYLRNFIIFGLVPFEKLVHWTVWIQIIVFWFSWSIVIIYSHRGTFYFIFYGVSSLSKQAVFTLNYLSNVVSFLHFEWSWHEFRFIFGFS
uniref:Uncharacterized protein n=1 Tax=Cacopsylla melanoneura TaxID=428564 RepID=A0A8D8YXU6_9HEMI